ncbi:MAG: hypothetical protein Q6354_09125 [Candidatus Brocadiales bacterium]|nr:hypothetical protein [Candidatus Brocadiales bacterium]
MEFTLVFEGEEDRGVDVVGNMQIEFEMPGIYWFQVELDGKPLTQIPLRIIYVPQRIMRTAGLGGEPPPV